MPTARYGKLRDLLETFQHSVLLRCELHTEIISVLDVRILRHTRLLYPMILGLSCPLSDFATCYIWQCDTDAMVVYATGDVLLFCIVLDGGAFQHCCVSVTASESVSDCESVAHSTGLTASSSLNHSSARVLAALACSLARCAAEQMHNRHSVI